MPREPEAGRHPAVVELSRLGHHVGKLDELCDELDERGVGLRILNLGIDTATISGKLIFRIIAAVALDGARTADRAQVRTPGSRR